MRFVASDFYSKSKYSEQALDVLLKYLLIKISEYMQSSNTEEYYGKRKQFFELRADIYENPKDYRSINDIAQKMNFSRSQFQKLYKIYFKISCINDVITARIKNAKFFWKVQICLYMKLHFYADMIMLHTL